MNVLYSLSFIGFRNARGKPERQTETDRERDRDSLLCTRIIDFGQNLSSLCVEL